MKRLLTGCTAFLLCAALLLCSVYEYMSRTMPAYINSVGDDNYTEKITGLYLLKQSAAQGDNLIIYGSSELRTLDISTHPANFFAGECSGFQVNLVGRGSCQSLIHAISIAASGDSLSGQKVVLITSPQSYVEGGIAPDMFMANFSRQQYLQLLQADDISDGVKQALSQRISELFDEYEQMEDAAPIDAGIRYLARHHAQPTVATAARNAILTPYYSFSRYLTELDDMLTSRRLLQSLETSPISPQPAEIDWRAEEEDAIRQAQQMSSNNDFGMLDGYYTTYIGSRLARQRGMDSELDYSVSQEYDDLRLLFEICRQKGIEPLFIHVPLHGQWSDYTGFTADRRQQYYQNVRDVVDEYGMQMLDLSGYEYEEYFLCDVMHLGWKGWLQVDQALINYYYDL